MHSEYMKKAIAQAELALERGEVPVGAVIIRDGRVIASAHNRVEELKDALAHAEMLAIRMAEEKLGDWRLTGCSLYVTLEPCPMCTGAILNSRLDEVVFGAFDEEMGCCSSAADLTDGLLSRRVRCIGGIMEKECAEILGKAFRRSRADTKKDK